MFSLTDSKSRQSETPSLLPDEPALAIAYVAFQQTADTVDADQGFCRGTVFPGLYKPFTGKRGVLE